MNFKSNAKINLGLKVLGVVQDCFGRKLHELETIMIPINLYDKITIEESYKDEIIGMDIPIESNIMYKALMMIKKNYNIEKCIKIIIEKNIPIFAGLGGGSGNAASLINALNEFWNLNMTIEEKVLIGKQIGSDVPFFIYNKLAFVYGTGEKIKLMDEIINIKGILIFDDDYCSTKEVFENVDKSRENNNINVKSTIINNNSNNIDNSNKIEKRNVEYKDIASLSINYVNDLEKGLNSDIYTKISAIKKDLIENGAAKALMSGSGGAVFGVYENDKEIEESINKLSKKYRFVYKFENI